MPLGGVDGFNHEVICLRGLHRLPAASVYVHDMGGTCVMSMYAEVLHPHPPNMNLC